MTEYIVGMAFNSYCSLQYEMAMCVQSYVYYEAV